MRKLLVLLTGCFLVAGIIGMLLVYSGYRKGQTEYADLVSVYYKKDDRSKISVKNTEAQIVENEVQLPADAPLPATIDFYSLMQINEDIVGWIDIPAIDISYPILSSISNRFFGIKSRIKNVIGVNHISIRLIVNTQQFIYVPIQINGSKQIISSHPLLILSTIVFLNILLQKVKSCFTYKLIPTHDVFSFQYFFKCDTIHRIVIVSFVFKFITTQSHDFYSLFSFI